MMIQNKTIGTASVVNISGRMDIHIIPEIEEKINQIIKDEPHNHMILNLKDVEYMSSSGLRMLITTMRTLNDNKKELKLCNLNTAVIKIFEAVELIDRFDIYQSEEDAINSLKGA